MLGLLNNCVLGVSPTACQDGSKSPRSLPARIKIESKPALQVPSTHDSIQP